MKNIRNIFLLFSIFMCFCFIKQVHAINPDDPVYDITALKIYSDENKDVMEISGWAYIRKKNNGKYSTNKIEYMPYYEICVKDKNGNTVYDSNGNPLCGSYYKGDNSKPSNSPFSLTCVLFYQHAGGNNGQDCMNYGKNFDARNDMINKSVNQPNYYYDAVDFTIYIKSLSALKNDEQYHLELRMKIGDYWSNSVKLSVFNDRIDEKTENRITVSSGTNYATAVVESGLMQNFYNFSPINASRIQNQCYFKHGALYQYTDKIDFTNYVGTSDIGVKYYGYQLDISNRIYDGNCSSWVFDNNTYAGAHAAWVQPDINTHIIITKKNPCIYGEGNLSPTQYAIANPGVCCDEIPETCCGNKVYMDKVIKNENGAYDGQLYILSSDYCCNESDKYSIKYYEQFAKQPSFFTFRHYVSNDLESFKQEYWRNFDSTKRYTNEYINNICSTKRWNGKYCPSGTTKKADSITYSMNRVNRSSITNKQSLSTYMYLDESTGKSSQEMANFIAYDYFSDSDFKTSSNSNYKDYSLNNEHFSIDENSIKISGPTKINNKYRYKINFDITIDSTDGVNLYNNKYYYVPVKFWYCESKEVNDCKDPKYFDNNIEACCSLNSTDSRCKCNISMEKCNTILEDADCRKTESQWNTGSYTNRINNKSVTETITFKNYPNLQSSELQIRSGQGFSYTIDVEHKITWEGHYNSDNSCWDGSNCNTLKNNIRSYYNEMDGYQTTYQNSISNLKYMFNGGNKEEKYIIQEVRPNKNILDTDSVTIYHYYYDYYGNITYYTEQIENLPSKVEYIYTYKLILSEKFIAKLQNSKDEEQNITSIDGSDYIDGGNEFYTDLSLKKGKYNIKITLEGNGITGYLNKKGQVFTCQYDVLDGLKSKNENDKTGKYYFRPISLSTPFPRNTIGKNWSKFCANGNNCEYITTAGSKDNFGIRGTDKSDNVYGTTPMYEVTLTSELITQIKNYNKTHDYGWNNMTNYSDEKYGSTSNFFKDSSINWDKGINLKLAEEDIRKVKVGDF